MQSSHVRQHYIPQFILRSFCHDQRKGEVFFFATDKKEPSCVFVSNVFMEKYLYSKAINQNEVEESLAKFEAEMAPIFRKFSQDTEISLTFAEDERLRIFLSLLAFRAASTRDQFNDMSDLSKALYCGGSDNADMKELWLRNVHLLSECRSIKEILGHSEVSNPLKIFISSEFTDYYMCLLERRGDVDFHISDCYPVVMNGMGEFPIGQTYNLPIYFFYPISDSRIIVLVTNHIKDVSRSVVHLDCHKTLKGPKKSSDGAHLLFRPEKIYSQDVEWINEMIIKNAQIGVVVKDLDRCSGHL